MKFTGEISYDPVTQATGKARAAAIRREAHELANLCRVYRPLLRGPQARISNQLDELLCNDPHYWTRQGSNCCTANQLDKLLSHAQHLQWDQAYPQFTKAIASKLKVIDQKLILTREELGWLIIRVSRKSIEPFLQEIRADGTRIQCSVWGPHISVVRGENKAAFHRNWEALKGQRFTLEVSEQIRSGRGYKWLSINATAGLSKVRTDLGLNPNPRTPFHLTLGKTHQ
jgi:hypothetical protein